MRWNWATFWQPCQDKHAARTTAGDSKQPTRLKGAVRIRRYQMSCYRDESTEGVEEREGDAVEEQEGKAKDVVESTNAYS